MSGHILQLQYTSLWRTKIIFTALSAPGGAKTSRCDTGNAPQRPRARYTDRMSVLFRDIPASTSISATADRGNHGSSPADAARFRPERIGTASSRRELPTTGYRESSGKATASSRSSVSRSGPRTDKRRDKMGAQHCMRPLRRNASPNWRHACIELPTTVHHSLRRTAGLDRSCAVKPSAIGKVKMLDARSIGRRSAAGRVFHALNVRGWLNRMSKS